MIDYIFLVPISLLVASIALIAFLWALNSEQYEDLDGAAERILMNDDVPITSSLVSPAEEKKT